MKNTLPLDLLLHLENIYALQNFYFPINFASQGQLEIPFSFGEPCKPIVYNLGIREAAEGTDCSMAIA